MTTTRRTVSGSEAVQGTGSGSMSMVLALLAFSVFINYIDRGSFTIAGGKPGMKVSWQVTARRNDAYMKAHRYMAEQDKPGRERGYYTDSELYGAPKEQGIRWAHPSATKDSAPATTVKPATPRLAAVPVSQLTELTSHSGSAQVECWIVHSRASLTAARGRKHGSA
jgi:hypothetical protein